MKHYNLTDYQAIQSTYVLPQSVMAIISTLSQKFGFSIPVTMPDPKPRNRHRMKDDQWQNARDFKPTLMKKEENKLNDVRVALNKLSQKNYDTTCDFIIQKIKEIVVEGEQETNIVQMMMDIISSNKIFSVLYAQFYKKLVEEFPSLFAPTLDTIQQQYLDSIQNIRFVDQNTNYDEFCKNNKENDRRKTIALFISHLTTNGQITLAKLSFMTNTLLDIVLKYMKEENKTSEVEEITENIYVFITNQKNMEDAEINEKITQLSKIKVKDYPSISSRAIFKYIDIMESRVPRQRTVGPHCAPFPLCSSGH
jgi:hypothetical protein